MISLNEFLRASGEPESEEGLLINPPDTEAPPSEGQRRLDPDPVGIQDRQRIIHAIASLCTAEFYKPGIRPREEMAGLICFHLRGFLEYPGVNDLYKSIKENVTYQFGNLEEGPDIPRKFVVRLPHLDESLRYDGVFTDIFRISLVSSTGVRNERINILQFRGKPLVSLVCQILGAACATERRAQEIVQDLIAQMGDPSSSLRTSRLRKYLSDEASIIPEETGQHPLGDYRAFEPEDLDDLERLTEFRKWKADQLQVQKDVQVKADRQALLESLSPYMMELIEGRLSKEALEKPSLTIDRENVPAPEGTGGALPEVKVKSKVKSKVKVKVKMKSPPGSSTSKSPPPGMRIKVKSKSPPPGMKLKVKSKSPPPGMKLKARTKPSP